MNVFMTCSLSPSSEKALYRFMSVIILSSFLLLLQFFRDLAMGYAQRL